VALLEEMLLEPRWDEAEFELAKLSAANALKGQLANPNAIANVEYNKVFYGPGHILSRNSLGTAETIAAITLDDLKAYYSAYIVPSVGGLHIAGDVGAAGAAKALEGLAARWQGEAVEFTAYEMPAKRTTSNVYFYDVPGAKQSVLRFGYALPGVSHSDHYASTVLNYILGGGGFASRLTQELREGKGYTYGIRSSVFGSKNVGQFRVSSGVRSNVTLEAAALIKSIMADYGTTYSAADLDVTKSFLIKSGARASETLARKLGTLQFMSTNDRDASFIAERNSIVNAMTLERIQELAENYIRPDQMIYLVVGDAATQRDRLKELGYGDPVALN